MKKSIHFLPVKILCDFLIPFVFAFAFYLQIHGEISPGGGFQSGIVLLIGFVIRDLVLLIINEEGHVEFFISDKWAKFTAVLGVIVYGMVGFFSIVVGKNAFDYSYFILNDSVLSNKIGLFLIELGVALSVFGAMSLIYKSFRNFVLHERK